MTNNARGSIKRLLKKTICFIWEKAYIERMKIKKSIFISKKKLTVFFT